MKHPDFREMIFAMQKKTGLRAYQLAARIGVADSTFNTWKNRQVEPLFSHGVALLDFYVKHVGPEIPTLREGGRGNASVVADQGWRS